MAKTQSDSSSPPPCFFHDDLCIWELVDHDDDDDSEFGVQSLDSFPSSSSDHDCDYDEILETSRPGIDRSLPDSIEQDSNANEADGDDGDGDDDACGVSGFYSASIDPGQNQVLELESLGQYIEPDGFVLSAEIDHEEMGNGLCENGSVDDSNGGAGGEEHDVVVVDDTGSWYVDLGQNPFLEWDSLYQFIANAILGAGKQVGSDSTQTALDDVNAGVGMSSRNDCEDVNGIYVNEDHSDHDVLGGYHSDHEVKANVGTSSNVQEVGVSGSPVCGHPRGYDAIICRQPSGSDHEELIVNQAVEHDDSDDDVPNDDDEEDMDMDESDGAYDLHDELVPWGLSHRFRGQRMRKLAKRPCAKMTKAKRTARIYVNRGCIHGKHSVGLIEAC